MRNLRSTVFSLHRQELMAATTLLPVYKQWGICSQNSFQSVYEWGFPISFQKETLAVSAQYYRNQSTATLGNGALLVDAISPFSVTLRLWDSRDVFIIAIGQ